MIAHAALGRAGGRARVLARLTGSTYLTAGGEIVWLGAADAALHPRAILAAAPALDADEMRIDVGGLTPWRPALPALDGRTLVSLGEGWRRLVTRRDLLGPPAGFGALAAGGPLDFPLADARGAAGRLADACARDDAPAATAAALALLGLGGGLTPSGDDYVGAALFGRRLVARAGLIDAAAWRRVAGAVLAAAPARTHPISVALLGDLAAGLAWAPLHDLVAALAAEAAAKAVEPARRLIRLGHSSGWDMLAGLGAGLGALTA
jgi:hypothetical protein